MSITSLFSGIFIVVAGGLVDRLGRAKILYLGIWLSIAGSLLIALTPENLGGLTSAMLLGGRVVQVLSAAYARPWPSPSTSEGTAPARFPAACRRN